MTPISSSSFQFLTNTISPLSIISSTTITKHSNYKSSSSSTNSNSVVHFKFRANSNSNHLQLNPAKINEREKPPRVLLNTLNLLEWDKLCNLVFSFAATPLGRRATKERLWSVDQTYDESLKLQKETIAAVEMLNHDPRLFDFTRIDVLLVRTAVNRMWRDAAIDGREAIAVVNLLQFAKSLQINVNNALRGSNNFRLRVMPLAELVLDWPTNDILARSVLQVINEDGSIKDSASLKLKRAREQVKYLDNELCQLMNALIAKETSNPSLVARKIYGRWFIQSEAGHSTNFKGLLVSSGAGTGNIIKPISAIPLNDKLQEAEAIVAEAEAEVLLSITAMMKTELDDIVKLLNSIVELDVVNARASYSLSVKGTFPDLILIDGKNVSTKKQRILHLPQALHPLLIEHHQRSLQEARRDLVKSTSMGLQLYFKFRSRKMHTKNDDKDEIRQLNPTMLQAKVTQLERAHPTPVDFVIDNDTRVVLISGPNMGGKTVCLKTLGLAAVMAKTGLCVLCSEPAQIPWFGSVFADIGDQQSLTHSLSTFSGHLKQISDIQAKSTSQSLVLLDEIGAGTNPWEGAALGISILKSFSTYGALLTVATTHHGDLKTLKYCNEAFENACMEFDEINLKPTYKLIWGVPGRSKAIRIAERLGMLEVIVSNALELYGAANTDIDEVIIELEKFRHDVQEYIHEAKHFIMLSKDLIEKLQLAQVMLTEHC